MGMTGQSAAPSPLPKAAHPSCDIVPSRMSDQAKAAVDVALLAPVPLVHLISGREKCNQVGRVAFASDDFGTFRELDQFRSVDEPVDAYLYASHADGTHDGVVSWHARYVRRR